MDTTTTDAPPKTLTLIPSDPLKAPLIVIPLELPLKLRAVGEWLGLTTTDIIDSINLNISLRQIKNKRQLDLQDYKGDRRDFSRLENYLLELAAIEYLYSMTVFQQYKPLKIGARQDILKRHKPKQITKMNLRKALVKHVRTYAYLSAIISGQDRYDLEGNVDGSITPENILHSQETLAKLYPDKV